LADLFTKENTLHEVMKIRETYPTLGESFYEWLENYAQIDFGQRSLYTQEKKAVYNISLYNDYLKSVIHYISSMTDNFAITIFGEITKF
jgi:dGTPase